LFLQNLHFSTGVGGHGFVKCPYLRLGIAHMSPPGNRTSAIKG